MPRTPCSRDALPCHSYAPGHCLHVIHAKHVGRTPWGWRDGVVVEDDGDRLVVQYLEQDHLLHVWHHRHLRELHVGDPVQVHEQYRVLGGPFGWLNTVLTAGLGPVARPAQPALWDRESVVPVVDVATGRALPLAHE